MAEIQIEIEPLEEGGYLANSEELQRLVAWRRTVVEPMGIVQDGARNAVAFIAASQ